MSIVVEHDKRRKEILEKALNVFVEEGFEDATFQKIADRCGITRTTLYIYFKNKKDIFNYSIKQFLSGIEHDIEKIRGNEKMASPEKLIRTISVILDRIENNGRMLSVTLDYIFYLSKSDSQPEYRVRRRTLRARHFLANMVIEGIEKGELKEMNIRTADDLLYGIIESAIFRLVVLKRSSVKELKRAAELAVRGMEAPVPAL